MQFFREAPTGVFKMCDIKLKVCVFILALSACGGKDGAHEQDGAPPSAAGPETKAVTAVDSPETPAIAGGNAAPPFAGPAAARSACQGVSHADKTLVHAIADRDIKLAECLIERGADVNQRRAEKGFSLLCLAVIRDEPPLIALFINKGAVIDDFCTKEEQVNHIHQAAGNPSVAALAALIDGGANVNQRAGAAVWGYTPLMFAADAGELENVRLLLSRGAAPCIRSSGLTALSIAESRGHRRIADLILSHTGGGCR